MLRNVWYILLIRSAHHLLQVYDIGSPLVTLLASLACRLGFVHCSRCRMTHRSSWIHCSELRISLPLPRPPFSRSRQILTPYITSRWFCGSSAKHLSLRPTFGKLVPTPDFRRIDLALGEWQQRTYIPRKWGFA